MTDNTPSNRFGDLIRTRRIILGYTQRQLGEMCGYQGRSAENTMQKEWHRNGSTEKLPSPPTVCAAWPRRWSCRWKRLYCKPTMAPPPNKKPQGIASLAALDTTIIAQSLLSFAIIFCGEAKKNKKICKKVLTRSYDYGMIATRSREKPRSSGEERSESSAA